METFAKKKAQLPTSSDSQKKVGFYVTSSNEKQLR